MKQKLQPFVWKYVAGILLVIFNALPSQSQNLFEKVSNWEGGFTIGPSNFLGDLGGNYGRGTTFLKDNNLQMTKLMIGGFLSYQPSEWINFRLSLNAGTLEGDDAIIKGKGGLEEARKIRNSNFKSRLLEGFIAMEIYPTVFFEYEPIDVFHKLRPYGLIGVGAFHFNPKGYDNFSGTWVDLKPLHTEGQGFPEYPDRKEYKLTQLNIPMGIGIKYFVSDKTSLSLEIIHRKTFTDYIDDVSTNYINPSLFYTYLPTEQARLAERMANKTDINNVGSTTFGPGDKRGTPTNNDAYYSIGFKIGIRLGTDDSRRYTGDVRCPIRF
ncbi:MAG: outer membrane beta-barrel protein [Chitinophagaceae bacterium]|nr:outer membrane beta-barrel protein [Chitinophagaceae bacterium]